VQRKNHGCYQTFGIIWKNNFLKRSINPEFATMGCKFPNKKYSSFLNNSSVVNYILSNKFISKTPFL
jgi:hypothetical protein